MRKIILPLIILSLLFGGAVLAQETELPNPGLTPDSPFYFLETITEAIGTFFTFGDLKKAERHATLAAERLAEAQVVAGKGKPKLTEKTLARYEMQLQNSIARAEKAGVKGENTEKIMEIMTRVGQATSKHLEVLAEVYEKVPEQAKPAIENAMKVSVKGHEKAVEALKAQNALGEVSEEAPLSEKIPQEVRERVQMKVQQELEIEEALRNYESPRDFCVKAGASQEMCEKIPLAGFESFEAIKSFCLETGGPIERCSSLEAECREMGATTPDECFVALSVKHSAATLEEEGVSGQRSESQKSLRTLCIEAGGPPETCEQIGSIDTSKSLRDICAGQGGSPEICEQFPDKKFESFKEIEDYCIGLGGQLGEQTDVCSTLEQKCREVGVTAPNECFLFLMTATITSSPAPEIETHIVEPKSEEEMKERERRLEQRYTPGVSKVVIYFLPTCPHCVEAKEWLNQHNIEYEAIDISESKAAGEELTTRTGGSGVPTIVMDNQVLIGFTEKLYSEFFGIE